MYLLVSIVVVVFVGILVNNIDIFIIREFIFNNFNKIKISKGNVNKWIKVKYNIVLLKSWFILYFDNMYFIIIIDIGIVYWFIKIIFLFI